MLLFIGHPLFPLILQRLAIRLVALIAVVTQLTAALAEDSKSHLVFLSESEFQANAVVTIKNADGKAINISKWQSGLPFYRDLVVPPAKYSISFGATGPSFSVETSDKTETFFQISNYSGNNIIWGLQITIWQGEPNSTVQSAISEIAKAGYTDALEPIPLGGVGNILIFNTEPPWAGPFRPKPPPPPPK